MFKFFRYISDKNDMRKAEISFALRLAILRNKMRKS